MDSKSPGAFSESEGNCCRVRVRTLQSYQLWDEGNTNVEKFSLFSRVVAFYFLQFTSSFCDYNAYQLQGSFKHRREKKNCTLQSLGPELWSHIRGEASVPKYTLTFTGGTGVTCQSGRLRAPQHLRGSSGCSPLSCVWDKKQQTRKLSFGSKRVTWSRISKGEGDTD